MGSINTFPIPTDPISALVAYLGAPHVDDLLVAVDVHDSTQSTSGSTKKLTVTQLFTNPTVTGNLTVTNQINGFKISLANSIAAGVATFAATTVTSTGGGVLSVVNSGAGGITENLMQFLRGAVNVGYIAADSSDNFVIQSGAGGAFALTIDRTSSLVTLLNGLTLTAGDATATAGNFITGTAGKGLRIKSGSNARIGSFTLNGSGSATVANTSVTTSTVVLCMPTSNSGLGQWRVTKSAGVGFTVTSSGGSDASTGDYVLVESV